MRKCLPKKECKGEKQVEKSDKGGNVVAFNSNAEYCYIILIIKERIFKKVIINFSRS